MRKALIGMILAATMMTPAIAEAQRGHRGGDRGGWSERNNGGRNARTERAESRSDARQSQPQAQPQPQPQPQQQAPRQRPQPQVAQGPRGGDGNRGNWNRGGNNDGNRGFRGGGGGDRGDRARRQQPSIYPQAWQGNPNDPRLQHYRELERRNQNRGVRRGDRDRDGRNWRNDRNDRNARDGRRNWRNDWNRGWRNDNRYNWNGWRARNRHIFRLRPYYSPYRNWSYRRFSIGLVLNSLFYNQRYWIADPWQYRLPAAPYGTQWVRYYNDVRLVDIYSGEVIDVIYDFFW